MSEQQRYPLLWPQGRPRRAQNKRRDSLFGVKGSGGYKRVLTVTEAMERLQSQIDMLGARDYVLSSNLALRLDGRPRGDQGNPVDPGVALYFTLRGKPHCLPCDTFLKASDNIAAIAAHIEASRSIERYGVGDIEAIFAGFLSLAAPVTQRRHWLVVFGFESGETVTRLAVDHRYRKLAAVRHPDLGGSNAAMAELNRARDEAYAELGE